MSDFSKMLRNMDSFEAARTGDTLNSSQVSILKSLRADIASLVDAEGSRNRRASIGVFENHLRKLFRNTLSKEKIRSGTIAELGGASNSFMDQMRPEFSVKFLSIFPFDDPRCVVADITNCPQVKDESFEAVFSKSVLEHVKDVGSATKEIVRILKPGGITMHAVPFSYFFHGAPEDYWRFTTTAFETLFEELETIECFFYGADRRRNNLGSTACPVDRDGGALFAIDAFGGWRETWFTVYVGRKRSDGKERLSGRRAGQLYIDLIKGIAELGHTDEFALSAALRIAAERLTFDEGGRVKVLSEPRTAPPNWILGEDELQKLWLGRGKLTTKPSRNRFNLMAILQSAGITDQL